MRVRLRQLSNRECGAQSTCASTMVSRCAWLIRGKKHKTNKKNPALVLRTWSNKRFCFVFALSFARAHRIGRWKRCRENISEILRNYTPIFLCVLALIQCAGLISNALEVVDPPNRRLLNKKDLILQIEICIFNLYIYMLH